MKIARQHPNAPPMILHGTWIEAEEYAYPHGGFTRRAFVELRRNPNNAIELPYGQKRTVLCSIPDTFSTIPARLRFRGKTIAGFLSITRASEIEDDSRYTFTPEADAKFYAKDTDRQKAPAPR